MKRTDRLNQRRRVTAQRSGTGVPPVRIEGHGQDARATITAFTLIELLVVIAIIGILAALVFPVVGVVNRNKQLSLAKVQMQAIQQAIEGYHTKLGNYPPDNTNNPAINPLYFELLGTTNDGAGKPAPTTWGTLDGSAVITTTASAPNNIYSVFSLAGLANSSTRAHSDDTGSAASTFLAHLLPNQYAPVDTTQPQILVLVCPVTWPSDRLPILPNNKPANPWRYVSTNPTNNTGSYDLWVDLVIRGKTNRVCNWSANPIQL
jgi:prepilin-type N-terminal cleavage/methylation domain-containing protein